MLCIQKVPGQLPIGYHSWKGGVSSLTPNFKIACLQNSTIILYTVGCGIHLEFNEKTEWYVFILAKVMAKQTKNPKYKCLIQGCQTYSLWWWVHEFCCVCQKLMGPGWKWPSYATVPGSNSDMSSQAEKDPPPLWSFGNKGQAMYWPRWGSGLGSIEGSFLPIPLVLAARLTLPFTSELWCTFNPIQLPCSSVANRPEYARVWSSFLLTRTLLCILFYVPLLIYAIPTASR